MIEIYTEQKIVKHIRVEYKILRNLTYCKKRIKKHSSEWKDSYRQRSPLLPLLWVTQNRLYNVNKFGACWK